MYYVDTSFRSLIKYGEELCGDHVEQVNLPDSKILVLSDGLGSGVKANILATLTSKIASTMLKEGTSIDDTIDTIVHTLPVCAERQLAYSTFTIIKADKSGRVYVAEFDGPPYFLHKNGQDIKVEKTCRIINNKKVYESNFYMDKDCQLVVVSDGVINAGVGMLLNLGWEWENVNEYLRMLSSDNISASEVCLSLMDVCQSLYDDKPGDDTTVLSLKMCEQETVNMMIGPPENPDNDEAVVRRIFAEEGKTVVCGGTTANIVSRVLDREITVDTSTMTDETPPIGHIQGVALVVEGVITLSQTVKIMEAYMNPVYSEQAERKLKEKTGSSMLAKMLIDECNNLNIWMGQAVNPAHQDAAFMRNFNFKESQTKELKEIMEKMGKTVKLRYT